MKTIGVLCVLAFLQMPAICSSGSTMAAEPAEIAQKILSTSGVKGGLVVHVNCGDGQVTASLRASDAYLVHGLAHSTQDLEKVRQTLGKNGRYGPVSVDLWTGGTLPYIDNSVNLLVISEPTSVSRDEQLRVLCPGGVALFLNRQSPIENRKWTKPRPDNIDEWTHYMHDATNNAVAHDTAIGPLRHLQWDGGPQYSRHHEYTSSVAAMVSAQGRLFSIMDMGSRASIQLPAKWRLRARDAFNGIVLWERPIESWFNHLWPLKDGPAQPPRRLVAVGDSVYVTLGLEAPVSRLDAATGDVLDTYAGTDFTEEILHADGSLILLRGDRSMNPKDYYPKLMICWDEKNRTMKDSEGYLLKPETRHIISLDAKTGKVQWKADFPIEPLTLAADGQNVYFHDWTGIVCLDRTTGEKRWQSEPVAPRESMGYVYGPTLVAYGDVVLFADGRRQRRIFAVSKKDGNLLWQAPHYPAGHAGSPEDLMVVDGLVWCGKIAGGQHSGVFTGRDPNTGEVKREFTPDVKTYWFHHRCYRAKATDKYILTSRTGIEFVDVRNQNWETHHWVRGACTYGIVPSNGLVYAPPHPCACYLESKLRGVSALAPASQRTFSEIAPAESRLTKGPAYSQIGNRKSLLDNPHDWPTYRGNAARSGATDASVELPLSDRWRVDLPGRLTAPVVAGGQVYVASQDTHTVHALNANDGKTVWTFTVGGRVDSPPTVYRGRVIFGAADGRVYCLRASDGALVWRFAAAPRDMRLVSYGRLESVWPVHGSVLVRDGKAYCVAGRSTMLDGGLSFYCLDVATGQVLIERTLYDQKNPQQDVQTLNMPVASTDILSSDGSMIYMLSQAFDTQGNRLQTLDPAADPLERATMQIGEGAHLFSPTGFLDDDAWHRSYWVYGKAFSSGCNWWFRAGRYAPAGRMMVFDGERVYGFGREPGLFVWTHVLENHLFCAAKQADEEAIASVKQWSNKVGRDAVFNRQVTRQTPTKQRLAPNLHWSVTHPPLHVRAMALAGGKLLVAGPPDVLDEDEAYNRPFAGDVKAAKVQQDAAYKGDGGAVLMALSADEGEAVFQVDLPAPPVWDGMAVTENRVYMTTVDGKVVCMDGR
ncbi:MAG: PQQ-binding-like beta-propeller repeat protein [Pirellulaceae bacterium]|nr:PQQ-binding-like beta-propeller repeat protein [Pirellulaceae bacterium]